MSLKTTVIKGLKYIQHVLTPKTLTIVAKEGDKDKVITYEASSNEYAEGVGLIRKKDFKKLPSLGSTKPPAGVKLDKDTVWFNDEKLPPALAAKARSFITTKADIAPLKAFWERCKLNPLDKSREMLFGFVEKYGITIIRDGKHKGCMLLYKGVNANLTSLQDNATKHVFGKPTTVERKRCEFTPGNGCGYGLHSAPFEYVKQHYNRGVIIEVIVDPQHVTSIPYSESKMRSCEYIPNCHADKRGVGVKSGLVATVKKVKAVAPKEPVSRAKYAHIPFLDSITIPGFLTSKAGFSAGQKVKVWLGRNRVIIAPHSLSDGDVTARYKVFDSVEATIKTSGSLRIRALVIGKHLGVGRKDEFKAAMLETNAIAIYKA